LENFNLHKQCHTHGGLSKKKIMAPSLFFTSRWAKRSNIESIFCHRGSITLVLQTTTISKSQNRFIHVVSVQNRPVRNRPLQTVCIRKRPVHNRLRF